MVVRPPAPHGHHPPPLAGRAGRRPPRQEGRRPARIARLGGLVGQHGRGQLPRHEEPVPGRRPEGHARELLERAGSVDAEGSGGQLLERPPFLLIVNFIVPWGSFRAYFCRPDADDGPHSTSLSAEPSERAWRAFVDGDQSYRNARLKFIPRVVAGPWIVKKVVGSTPAIIGNKLPVTYRGSAGEGYLEVCMDVTAGPSIGNTIANTVVGRADAVTVDLAFVVEAEGEMLPERVCGAVRLHHLSMKRAPVLREWMERVDRRVR